jgi:hypothetical protein
MSSNQRWIYECFLVHGGFIQCSMLFCDWVTYDLLSPLNSDDSPTTFLSEYMI